MEHRLSQFSDLVSEAYDCALDPTRWEPALIKINEALRGAYTSVSVVNHRCHRAELLVHSPWDSERLKALHRDFAICDVPGARDVTLGGVDSPASTLATLNEAEFQSSRFYREWAGPQGLRDSCLVKFIHTPNRIGLLSVVTRADRDVITAGERKFVALLSPHLRRAALMSDLLQNQQVERQLYQSAFDRLAVAVYFVDSNAKILYCNQSAETLLTQQSHFAARANILVACNPATATSLGNAIRRAGAGLGGGLGIPVSLGTATAAVAYVLPLNSGPIRSTYQPAAAAVFVSTNRPLPPELETVFANLYDLTPAEARLMHKIGSGLTVSAAAKALSVSETTIKTHLQRVFRKVDVSRQSELVALIEGLRPPTAATIHRPSASSNHCPTSVPITPMRDAKKRTWSAPGSFRLSHNSRSPLVG
jgi:DNA-binding CsgD family transcriptional regulator/PAS domain-containing protein